MSTLGLLLLVLLIFVLCGAVPHWGYSRDWGYGPSGIVLVILLVVIFLLATGRMPF